MTIHQHPDSSDVWVCGYLFTDNNWACAYDHACGMADEYLRIEQNRPAAVRWQRRADRIATLAVKYGHATPEA